MKCLRFLHNLPGLYPFAKILRWEVWRFFIFTCVEQQQFYKIQSKQLQSRLEKKRTIHSFVMSYSGGVKYKKNGVGKKKMGPTWDCSWIPWEMQLCCGDEWAWDQYVCIFWSQWTIPIWRPSFQAIYVSYGPSHINVVWEASYLEVLLKCNTWLYEWLRKKGVFNTLKTYCLDWRQSEGSMEMAFFFSNV